MTRSRALRALFAYGFDKSKHIPFTKHYRIGCSQCQALAVNGTATHEHGCPNAVHECRGCNTLVPMRQKYCEECK